MKKLISVLSVMLILFASVWAIIPAMAATLPVAPENGAEDVGLCAAHTFGEWSAETGADCTTHSYHTRICTVCQFVEVEKVSDKLGHQGTAYLFDEKSESHSFICVNCNETITEACTLVLETSAPQCATAVTNTYRCSVCNNTVTKTEAPTHNVATWAPVANSLQHEGLCAGCNQTVKADCVFTELTVTANCLEGGKRILQCECGRIIDENIGPMDHNVETWLHIEGTSIHAGHCTRCLASINNDCTVTNWAPNEIGADAAITHTGSCSVCNAPYTKDCVKGTFAGVAGTASHQTNCVDCSRIFTEFCTSDEKGLTSNNNGTHSANCAVCKAAFTKECTSGEFTHVENTKTHSTTCSECNGTYTEACEVATWTPSEKINAETGEVENGDLHKGNCAKCNAEYEEDCTVETYTIDVANKTCTGSCTACGDALTHESKLGAWKYDSVNNAHSVECDICDATASHTVTVAENGWKHVAAEGESCHEAACTVCTTVVLAACEFEDDATNLHKHTCKTCGYFYEDECTSFRKDSVNSTAATCTEKGYTYYNCSVCGKRVESKTLEHKALGHKLEAAADAEITSTDKDHTVTYKCKTCGITETKTEAHTFGKAEAGKDGKHTVKCTVCGKEVTENCKPEKMPAVEATCTKGGKTEGSKCSVCGAILKEQATTSAKGHDYKYHSTTATCSAAGKDIFKCVCGDTKEVAAAANGKHDWKETKRVAATASANGYVEYTCKHCTATYRETLVYSVNTGVGNAISSAAAIVLLSGVAFIGVKKLRKEED